MQDRVIIIPASAVSHLKKQAKRRQRETGRPHHELLEEVATSAGFQSWHQVTLAETATKALEKRLRASLVVLMDIKEASDLASEFEVADEVLALRDGELIQWLREADDDAADESDAELREFLHEAFVCMRYVGPKPLPTPSTVLDWFREYSFWQPDLVWLQGNLIDPQAPTDDDEDLDFDEEDTGPDEPMPQVPEEALRAAFGPSSARSRLVLGSPDTMERYKGIVGAREAWNWCLHCERAYPQGSYRQQGDLQMCPYAKCDGDAFMDLWTWSRIRKENPTYPEIPELSVRYGLYGNA